MVKFNKIDNKINEALHDKKFNRGLRKVGKFAEKQVLPAVVSTAIPLASTALGAVATTYGGPMAGQFVQGMSQNLMDQYIPDKYQSNNKYINMFGDALNQGIGAMNGDIDPNALMNLQGQFAGQVSKDLSRLSTPKQPKYNYAPQMPYFPPQMQYQKPVYNPDNPYEDLLQQLYNKYNMPPSTPQIQPVDDPNDDNDAIYKSAEIYNNGDNMTNAIPPFQQMEGSMRGLFGAGLRPEIHIDINSHNNRKGKYKMGEGFGPGFRPDGKPTSAPITAQRRPPPPPPVIKGSGNKRGRPKTASEVQKLQDKKMAEYSKKIRQRESIYSDEEYPELARAPNPSLHQYLNMSKRKAKKEGEEDLRAILKYMKEMEGIETPRERRRNKGHNI